MALSSCQLSGRRYKLEGVKNGARPRWHNHHRPWIESRSKREKKKKKIKKQTKANELDGKWGLECEGRRWEGEKIKEKGGEHLQDSERKHLIRKYRRLLKKLLPFPSSEREERWAVLQIWCLCSAGPNRTWAGVKPHNTSGSDTLKVQYVGTGHFGFITTTMGGLSAESLRRAAHITLYEVKEWQLHFPHPQAMRLTKRHSR